MRLGCSFSGGKDCTLAIYKAIQAGHEVVCLITTANENRKSWFHDIDFKLLGAIAQKMMIPLEYIVVKEGEDYTLKFEEGLSNLKVQYQLDGIIFGDIDLQGHFDWTKERCDNTNLQAINPLWQIPRIDIAHEIIDAGFKVRLKKVKKDYLSKDDLGKLYDLDLLNYFISKKIDVCGEQGEFHTIVCDGPIFKQPLVIKESIISETEITYSLNVTQYE